eukprot:Opistho-2@25424
MRPIRIVILGDTCGKTCLIRSLLFGSRALPEAHEPTVFELSSGIVTVQGLGDVMLFCVEVGSGNALDHIPDPYSSADVFLLCFSVASLNTFERIRRKWARDVRDFSSAPIILVGTQSDLRTVASTHPTHGGRDGFVTFDRAKQLADDLCEKKAPCKYLECSAVQNVGVREVFADALVLGFQCVKEKKGAFSKFFAKLSGKAPKAAVSKDDIGSVVKGQIIGSIRVSSDGVVIDDAPVEWSQYREEGRDADGSASEGKPDAVLAPQWNDTRAILGSLSPESYRKLRMAITRRPSGMLYRLDSKSGADGQVTLGVQSLALSEQNLVALDKLNPTPRDEFSSRRIREFVEHSSSAALEVTEPPRIESMTRE